MPDFLIVISFFRKYFFESSRFVHIRRFIPELTSNELKQQNDFFILVEKFGIDIPLEEP